MATPCDDYTYAVSETVYLGNDNAVTIVPYSDLDAQINYDMTAVTRVTAHADPSSTTSGDATIGDSDIGTYVDWDNASGEWRITCKVGLFPSITAGTYNLRVTIYDPINPNGYVLPGTDSSLQVTVVGLP